MSVRLIGSESNTVRLLIKRRFGYRIGFRNKILYRLPNRKLVDRVGRQSMAVWFGSESGR